MKQIIRLTKTNRPTDQQTNRPTDQQTNRPTSKVVKIAAIALWSILQFVSAEAQIAGAPASTYVNQQLRALFNNINPPSPPPPFFYDMAVHFVDTSWYRNQNSDTSSTTNFVTIYDEVYCAHYDTNNFLRVDTMYDRAMRFGSDTVVVGLIDYDFCKLKDSALFDSTYFLVDTNGPYLIDNPNAASSPYRILNLFTVAALREQTSVGNPVYRIDPSFLFIDPDNFSQYYSAGAKLLLDFDDGTGWHEFNTSSTQFYQATYLQEGWHTLSAQVVTIGHNKDTAVLKNSSSRAASPAYLQTTPSDTTWSHIDGLDIDVYWPCSNGVSQQPPKFVIFLEGIDFTDERKASQVYDQHIRETGLADLRNHGYAFVVVSWKQSKKSMSENAMHVVDLFDFLKCNYLDPNEDLQHQFVLMGESMGGVIGRYALTWMEANPNFSGCQPALHHNTRLFISFDAPHQGANVPMAFQELWNDLPFNGAPYNMIERNKWLNSLHNSDAVKQLLSHHSTTYDNGDYFPHQDRIDFMDELTALISSTGGYPQHCKLMAVSFGLLTGEMQLGVDQSCIMANGHTYVDLAGEFNFAVLGFPVVGREMDLLLKSAANGTPIYEVEHKVNFWGIKLNYVKVNWCSNIFSWLCFDRSFPMGFSVGYIDSTSHYSERHANNLPRYDRAPGSIIAGGSYAALYQTEKDFGPALFDPTGMEFVFNWGTPPTTTSSLPCEYENLVSIDLDLLLASFDLTVESQGLDFCFIPVKSALDYDGPLFHNISAANVATTMSKTPFDVISGEINGLPGYPQAQSSSLPHITQPGWSSNYLYPSYNQTHPTIRNHRLPGLDSLLLNSDTSYGLLLPAFYLNREVGDEKLYLDNLSMDRNVIIQAEYEIQAGTKKNPFYAYPGNTVDPNRVFQVYSPLNWSGPNPWGYNHPNNGILADDEPYTVEASTVTRLIAETFVDTTGTVVNGNLQVVIDTMWVCTETDYSDYWKRPSFSAKDTIANRVTAEGQPIYPNPVRLGEVTYIPTNEDGYLNVRILDNRGVLIHEQTFVTKGSNIIAVDTHGFPASGFYLIQVESNQGVTTYKLMAL